MPFQNYRAVTPGEAPSRVNKHRKGRSRPGRSRELPRPPRSGTRAQTKHGAREPFITPPRRTGLRVIWEKICMRLHGNLG